MIVSRYPFSNHFELCKNCQIQVDKRYLQKLRNFFVSASRSFPLHHHHFEITLESHKITFFAILQLSKTFWCQVVDWYLLNPRKSYELCERSLHAEGTGFGSVVFRSLLNPRKSYEHTLWTLWTYPTCRRDWLWLSRFHSFKKVRSHRSPSFVL